MLNLDQETSLHWPISQPFWNLWQVTNPPIDPIREAVVMSLGQRRFPNRPQDTDGSLVSNIFSFPLQKEGLLMINAGDDDDDDDDDEDDDSFNRETLWLTTGSRGTPIYR